MQPMPWPAPPPASPVVVGRPAQRAVTDPTDGTPDDAALVAALAAGDPTVLDLLYRRHRGACFATAFALMRTPEAAEDIVHEAFVRTWRGAVAFQPARGSVRGWLLTIVRNLAIDALRAHQLAARPQPTQVPWAAAAEEGDIPTIAAAAADARRLRAALRALPAAQRDAIELAFFAGLTHGEIAARTGAPLGTVKGRLRLGLRRLRHELRDMAPGQPAPASIPLGPD